MSLDKKSLTELRGIAQAMGMESRWDIGKEHLINEIQNHAAAKVKQPEKPIQVNIISPNEQGGTLRQEDVLAALDGFVDLGLKISFPDARTWELYCNNKRDSGTMAMPMWNVVQCARDIVKP